MDLLKTPVIIEAPGTLNVGGKADANDILEVHIGDITLDFPSCAALTAVSASAAVPAIQTGNKVGSRWLVMLSAKAWAAGEHCDIPIATCITNGIQATARNLATAAADHASRDYQYLAIRVAQQGA